MTALPAQPIGDKLDGKCLTVKERRYLKRLIHKAYARDGRLASKSEWFNPTLQSLLKARYIEWLTPTLRARFIRITDAGRAALASAESKS